MTPVWIGLGSNIGESHLALRRSAALLAALPNTQLRALSPCYWTAPWGVTDQPEFLNAVAKLSTRLEPPALLQELKSIEQRLGRRGDERRWGPREIDLDLLVYAGQEINLPELIVPHPHLTERAFVLVPLNDLSPRLVVPGKGRVSDLLAALDADQRAGVRSAEAILRPLSRVSEAVD